MGSISRMNRCERFIQEFGDDADKRFNLSDFPCVIAQHLAMSYGNEAVYMYYDLHWNDHDDVLMRDLVLFEPETDRESTISRVCELFGLEEEEAIKRLKKAQLIDD